MEAVTLINCFDIPAGREDEFFGLWQQVNAYMRTKPGYRGHKLHQALTRDAPFRFVNVAQWASAAHFQAAHDEGFRALVSQADWAASPDSPKSSGGFVQVRQCYPRSRPGSESCNSDSRFRCVRHCCCYSRCLVKFCATLLLPPEP